MWLMSFYHARFGDAATAPSRAEPPGRPKARSLPHSGKMGECSASAAAATAAESPNPTIALINAVLESLQTSVSAAKSISSEGFNTAKTISSEGFSTAKTISSQGFQIVLVLSLLTAFLSLVGAVLCFLLCRKAMECGYEIRVGRSENRVQVGPAS